MVLEETPSKLIGAFQQAEQQRLRLTIPSKSTPYQARRRPSMTPTPTRTPSMTLSQRRRAVPCHYKPSDLKLLPRLEEENANLPPQDSIEFILAQIERQNAILDEDPKSVCIQSNQLKAHLSTLQNLVTDSSNDAKQEDIDWEFWTALTEDFTTVALKLPHLVSAKLRAGIPPKVRGVIWQAMSQSASLNLETMYGQLVEEHSPYERIIQRDLARTFPHIDMFKQEGGDGQRALERILKAYSLYDSLVGYCQGLAFLVGPLLMNMPEQQAFCVIMETYELRTMFTLNMEGLQLRLYQFTSLLTQILPQLSDHLADHAINPPMYASQWFLTLFAYAFPIPLVMRIYDIVFAEGAAETIMRVAIAMLKRSEKQILALTEFEDILDFVTTKLYDAYNDDPTPVIADAMALSGLITKEKMDDLNDLYVGELEKEKKQTEQVLAVRFNFWSKNAQQQSNSKEDKKKKRESSSWLAKRNSSSSSTTSDEDHKPQPRPLSLQPAPTPAVPAPIGPDVATLHHQIEELLLALSQTQKEHIQLKQEFIQMKMDKMDAEAERDALKMTMEEVAAKGDHYDEFVKVKVENCELRQQIEELTHQNQMAKDAQNALIEQLMDLKNTEDQLKMEQRETRRLKQRLNDAEQGIQELQNEKTRLLQDLDKMSKPSRRRPMSVCVPESNPAMANYDRRPKSTVTHRRGSEASVRELEQMLVDAKLRIVQLETDNQSMRPQRHSAIPTKAVPTGSRLLRTKSSAASTPTSPIDPVHPSRRSLDSRYSSDLPLNKRSSFYGRFWSVLSSQQDTPPSSPIRESVPSS
ncbi:rab-GTPase-TBC domain-containing protein [Radiomyces spectabilis]|uniref:rab-GTPase-TBC domain-containing protein n=1 Tax=Radiomyces spectabilis TaxID=64574 RepID=UPI002220FB95|nr:rab-GTPase-TBC domain-containing protein [Radiomyces spectabilis]KAI8384488.1 rab-GTPase-TBC domain-containing protein [Radiomyces spectabilis]